MIDEGWWRGVCRGAYGLFPANYVEVRQWGPMSWQGTQRGFFIFLFTLHFILLPQVISTFYTCYFCSFLPLLLQSPCFSPMIKLRIYLTNVSLKLLNRKHKPVANFSRHKRRATVWGSCSVRNIVSVHSGEGCPSPSVWSWLCSTWAEHELFKFIKNFHWSFTCRTEFDNNKW